MFGFGSEKPSSASDEKSRDQRDEHLDMIGQGDGPLYPMSRRQREDYELAKNWRMLKAEENRKAEHPEDHKGKLQAVAEMLQLRSMDEDEEALMQFKVGLPTMPNDRAMDAISAQLEALPDDNFQRWQYLMASSRRATQIVKGLEDLNQQTGDVWDRAKHLEQELETATFSTLQSELAKRHSPLAEKLAREGLPAYHELRDKLGPDDLLRLSLPELCELFETATKSATLSDKERQDEENRLHARENTGEPVRQFDQVAVTNEAAKSDEQARQEEQEVLRLENHQGRLAEGVKILLREVNRSDHDSPLLSEISDFIDKGQLAEYLKKERQAAPDNLSNRLMSKLGRQQVLDKRLSDLYVSLVEQVEQEREPGMAAHVLLEARANDGDRDLIIENEAIHQANLSQFSGKLLESDYLPFKDRMDVFIQNADGNVFRFSPQKSGWLLEGQRDGKSIRERISKEDMRGFTWKQGAPWGFGNQRMGEAASIELAFTGSVRVAKLHSVANKLAGNNLFIADLPSRHFVAPAKQRFWQRIAPRRKARTHASPRPA